MKRLQLFRPGKHTASSGVPFSFSESDLQATAAAYDPAKHEAPIVVGHPRHDLPAYGWVKSLAFCDAALDAEPHQVDAAFAELVDAGRFKKISASFYAPDAPSNPVPGVYYLRHVGFLGAQPPAVKGLKPVEFADAEEGVIEFADWGDVQNATLWRRMRDWLIGEKGIEAADKIIPDYAVADLEAAARAPEASTAATPAYSETSKGVTMTPEQIAARESELRTQAEAQARKDEEQRQRDTEFAERETRLAAEETTRARADIVSFVEGLVTEGRILPAHKSAAVEALVALPADSKIEFAEGDKKVIKPIAAWLRDYLKASPKLVEFGERGAGDGSENASDDAQSIANRALEFQESERKAGREISVSAAVQHVTKPKQ